MTRSLATVSLLVRDYDEAIAWFTGVLGFQLLEDTPMGPGKRWVIVAPGDGLGAALLLARAATSEQQACIGRQAGGRVFLFLETSDFHADYQGMKSRGVHFVEEPRHEAYGWVVVFEDLCGNRWDLLERRSA
ncbi:VOC family protein [Aquabacterium sp.]|uniref:VOC family protein n=1 Tax=Aquabacterium sp. TaxID=1872578 RepID=UPI002C27BDD8|nr:VOC family protein [Aquabacterium sp.]HSW08655.1 VOC family protein [Aquabacterium sp.]